MHAHTRKSAFSLVELAIVLVILGLLAGGVLSGQSLIRAAELRSMTTDFDRYRTAIYNFRDKYFSLPGDMNNATKFWGSAGGDGTGIDTACTDVVSTTKATCNGNGDGIIRDATNTSWAELWLAWQHLANAGLIEGQYSGSINGLTSGQLIGKVVPRGKISNTGYQFWTEARSASGWTGSGSAETLGFIRFGGTYSGSDAPIRIGNNALSPEQAWNIDTKLDDGKPGTGIFWVHAAKSGTNPGPCIDALDTSTATYKLSNATTSLCLVQINF